MGDQLGLEQSYQQQDWQDTLSHAHKMLDDWIEHKILADPNMDNATLYIKGNLNIYTKLRGFTKSLYRSFIKDTPNKVTKSQKLRCFY